MLRSFLNRLMTEEDGATMVEYALMVALIAVAAMTAAATLGTNITSKFTAVATQIGG
ncbi:Flp family type IVb pilin [Paludisphaera rhizosphaerae]|uniref:Flp family type IVb pilin n=1 Tax=Paludisphaera rhizosphaerae TaxID=2711216 RepID=UPI0019822248|nr:Flp family type IVb pilin [Paludisphaera rhizosphaerae]